MYNDVINQNFKARRVKRGTITGVGPKCFVHAHLANEIAPCKLIQDSLATLDSTLWIQDSTTTTTTTTTTMYLFKEI